MADTYQQYRAAFSRVCAYIILKAAERVATVAFKYPVDGAGRLYAYCHVIGLPMTRGFAGGCGYDKHGAAVANAFAKSAHVSDSDSSPGYVEYCERQEQTAKVWRELAAGIGRGEDWQRVFEKAGFTVFQAV